ncbi:RNA-binding (RRM/RBD/RNP motifs) family protein [Actinidia rufa]|uniref:RNA-binding (RRM/RBD/RNP motifs) family protein n=1 Tax=Actinidia rufa TaxID=165716 RepID=A0A7J0GVE4_9ERIC|nr:RNA-binding (RRM/RBD/RNP motifs) family protein [Actinidia rufa]
MNWEDPMMSHNHHSSVGTFGDTTLTKVTFKDAEAAKKACEDATPIINGRRANCNLASLGARRPRSASAMPPPVSPLPPQGPPQGSNVVPRSVSPVPASHVQWYYPATGTPPSPFRHQHHQAVPFYGYVDTISSFQRYSVFDKHRTPLM